MGCTSSAPPHRPPSATDESSGTLENRTEATVHTIQKSEEIQVLPSCDSLVEQLNIDSNKTTKETAMDTPSLGSKPIENNFIQNSNEGKTNEEIHSTLEALVEQLVEVWVDNKEENSDKDEPVQMRQNEVGEEQSNDHLLDTTEIINETKTDGIDDKNGNNDISDSIIIEDKNTELRDSVEQADTATSNEVDELVDIGSPTESTSSRMTRWEALADIAAELPPSLTVDPLTGQIYTLTK